MHPEGEQSNSLPENNSEDPNPRRSIDYSSSYQRRPPLTRSRPPDVSTDLSGKDVATNAPSHDTVSQPPLTTESASPSSQHLTNQNPSESLDRKTENFQQEAEVIQSPAPQPQPVLQPQAQPMPPTPSATTEPQKISFTPPPKKRRSKLLTSLLALLGVIILVGGMIMLLRIQAAKNNPTTVMNDAINNSLNVKNVQTTTKSDASEVTTKYNLSEQKNPTVSTSATLKLPKNTIQIEGYGNAKNTYVSYSKLPKTISKDLANHTKDGWIQLRVDGKVPKDTEQTLVNISDPRFQLFGPLIMSNLPTNTRQQLFNFIKEHKIYAFNEKTVKKVQVGDQKMFVYEIKPDISYLKIASQSVAASLGFDPTEINAAIMKLEELRGGKMTIYINAKDHKFTMIKINKDGKEKTVTYTNYDKTDLPDEPQTKLIWPNFAQLQTVIDNQTGLTTATY